MPQSYIEYNSGLAGTTFSIPFKYINIDDVQALGYDGTYYTELAVASRDNAVKTITLAAAPSIYQKVRVYRSTATEQLIDFQNGSRLSESDLDTAYQQGLFVAQEVSEDANTNQYTDLTDQALLAANTSLSEFSSSTHTGDGTAVTFDLSFVPKTETPQAFLVIVDGILQSPVDAYTLTINPAQITFASSPPASSAIVVTTTAAATGTLVEDTDLEAAVNISNTPPSFPKVGELWYDNTNLQMFTYYDDGNGSPQWVSITGAMASTLVEDVSVTATGTTTARNLTDRFADTVNVKDFGAKGDGVTDDTAAIDNALTVATSTNKPLYFPHGTYVRNSTLSLPSGAIILGDGSPRLGVRIGDLEPDLDDKEHLRVGHKGKLSGSSILFKDTGTVETVNLTERNDDLSTVKPMVKTELGIKTVVRGIAFIQDMNVRDNNGDYTTVGNEDAATGYNVGHLIYDASHGIYEDVVIWGYFTKAGRVVYGHSGWVDPDYNKFIGGSTMGRYGLAIVSNNQGGITHGLSGTQCWYHSMYALDHHSRADMTEAERIAYYSTANNWRCLYIDGDVSATTAEINGHYFHGSTIRCKHSYPIELDHCSNVEFHGTVIEVSPYGITNSSLEPEIIGSSNIKKSVGFFGCRINYQSLIFKSFAGSLAAGINIIGQGDPLQDSWVIASDPNVSDGYAVMRSGTDSNIGDIGFQLTKDISTEGKDWRVGMDVSNADNLLFKYDNNIVSTITNSGMFAPTSYGRMVHTIDTLNISSGEINVGYRSHYFVDTEGDTSTDDLVTINGGVEGMRIIIQALSQARTVVLKANTGNLRLDSSSDKILDNSLDVIELVYRGSYWCQVSFSSNGS